MCIKTIIFVAVFGLSYGQLQTRSYSCVIPSLCRDGSIIDPRILNPSGGGAASPNPLSGAGGGGGAMPSGGGGGAFPSGGGGGGAFPNGGGGGGGGGGAPPSGGGGSAPGAPTPSIGIITQGSDCSSGYIRCTLVTCGTPSTQPSTQDGIATQNAFPWQAFLINNNNVGVRNGYAGGGVLLDQYHVLTAAHKVTNLTSVSVSMGVYSTANSGNVQTVQVAQVWIHSNYDQTYLKNDVAVLRLATPFNINNNAMPICLPTSGRSYIGATSSSCIVSGWGQTSFRVDDAPTQSLKQVHVPIVTNDACTNSYSNVLGASNAAAYLDFPNEICAGGQNQLDACTQDGGSPLVCSDTAPTFNLVGLVLWGKDCGQSGRYGVYLNVPSYVSWIQCTIQCIQGQTTCSNCPSRRII
ncbi:serine protease 42 [Dendroctonus ponderosae]|nr:serine protease 42 [Dendroctonus ponderosae]